MLYTETVFYVYKPQYPNIGSLTKTEADAIRYVDLHLKFKKIQYEVVKGRHFTRIVQKIGDSVKTLYKIDKKTVYHFENE